MANGQYNFLICSERSGSNFITKLMDGHPDICGPSPVHILRFFAPLEHKYGDLSNDENWSTFVGDIVMFFDLKVAHWEFSPSKEEVLALPTRTLRSVFDFYCLSEAKIHGKKDVFVKENHAWRLIPYYMKTFPEAKFVWLVRDPRDMALSWKKNQILRGEAVQASKIWQEDQKNSLYIWNSLQKTDKMIFVKYEDLTANSEVELHRICDFLNIEYSESMLNFRASASTLKNADSSPAWKNLAKGVMKDNSNKFMDGLTTEEIKYIEYYCQMEMEKFGYKPVFDIIEKPEFLKIQYDLCSVEKFTKEGYQNVSEVERTKRAEWSKCIKMIRSRH